MIYGEDELPLFVGIMNHPAGEGAKRTFTPVEPQTTPAANPQTVPETETEDPEEALERVDIANLRSAYGEAMSNLLTGEGDTSQEYKVLQKEAGWRLDDWSLSDILADAAAELSQYTGGSFSITVTANENGDPTATLNYFK